MRLIHLQHCEHSPSPFRGEGWGEGGGGGALELNGHRSRLETSKPLVQLLDWICDFPRE